VGALADAAAQDLRGHAGGLRGGLQAAPGGSLAFVQRQLGHRDYKTTEEVYGHLAHEFMVGSAAAAEALLYDASAAVTA
jgi:integrase